MRAFRGFHVVDTPSGLGLQHCDKRIGRISKRNKYLSGGISLISSFIQQTPQEMILLVMSQILVGTSEKSSVVLTHRPVENCTALLG